MSIVRYINGFIVKVDKASCLKFPDGIHIEAVEPNGLEREVKALAYMLPPLRANYSSAWNCLTLKFLGRLIGIYGSGKIVFCAKDPDEAELVLRLLRELIIEVRRRMGNQLPSDEELRRKSQLSALKLYNYLPKKNCGECGELTCIAFAIRVLNGDKKLSECPLLSESKYSHLIDQFKRDFGIELFKILWKGSKLIELMKCSES